MKAQPCENCGNTSGAYVPHISTNADRIRAMSDEELAAMFLSSAICVRDFADVPCDGISCRECRITWLQQLGRRTDHVRRTF